MMESFFSLSMLSNRTERGGQRLPFRHIALLLAASLLSACATRNANFVLPEQVHFAGTTYQKVTHNQLAELQQLLYLPAEGEKNPNNWQKGILFFLDQRLPSQSLRERMKLREISYAKQPQTQAQLQIEQDELRSQIIYPPTDRFANVQLEVTRGRNLACGYGQIQAADKRSDFAKNLPKLTAYHTALSQLAQQFSQLPWLIACR